MFYFDNASTTRIDDEVLNAMLPYLKEQYGNAGTLYNLGKQSKAAIESSRNTVAEFLNVEPSQIIFTSGGTESNNMVFNSLELYLRDIEKKHIVISAIEHDSVLKAAYKLENEYGFKIHTINPESNGEVIPRKINESIDKNTGLVSVMYMNNETGVENDVRSIAKICSENGVLFHTDCVQAACCCDMDLSDIGCDFASISSHKIHGPKGVGCLYIKDKSVVAPMICGGSEQEFGFRGGTENVAGIVGFAKACEILTKNKSEIDKHTSVIKQLFYNKLKEALKKYSLSDIIHVNGEIMKHGRTLNIMIDGIDSESLVIMLGGKDICASAGSACRSLESQLSHVLLAMGLTPDQARSSIRFSFSKYNTLEEIEEAVYIIAESIYILHSLNNN